MFDKACKKIRNGVYGVMGTSHLKQDTPNGLQDGINATNGSAFMVAPGYIITAAHMVHMENNPTKPIHQFFEVIRAPSVGQKMERAIFVAEDVVRDLAILKIENANDDTVLSLENKITPVGTNCGFLGFPLANVQFMQNGQRQFNLFERFQGAYISSYLNNIHPTGRSLPFYEIDTLMYSGSSGCPAFTKEGKVVGIQVASMMQKVNDADKMERVAISMVVPSTDIIQFLKEQKIPLKD